MKNKLGNFIRNKRLDMAYNQKMLAEKIGITYVSLSKIENGQHCGSCIIRKLAKYFNLPTVEIRKLMLSQEE